MGPWGILERRRRCICLCGERYGCSCPWRMRVKTEEIAVGLQNSGSYSYVSTSGRRGSHISPFFFGIGGFRGATANQLMISCATSQDRKMSRGDADQKQKCPKTCRDCTSSTATQRMTKKIRRGFALSRGPSAVRHPKLWQNLDTGGPTTLRAGIESSGP